MFFREGGSLVLGMPPGINQRPFAHNNALFCVVIGHRIKEITDELLLIEAFAKGDNGRMIHRRVGPTQAHEFAERNAIAQHRFNSRITEGKPLLQHNNLENHNDGDFGPPAFSRVILIGPTNGIGQFFQWDDGIEFVQLADGLGTAQASGMPSMSMGW